MGNQTSNPVPNPQADKSTAKRSSKCEATEDGKTQQFNMFDDGIDGLYDTEPFDNDIQHFIEVPVANSISKNALLLGEQIDERNKGKLLNDSDERLDKERDEEIQRIINAPPITTDTLARDAGVLTEFESFSQVAGHLPNTSTSALLQHDSPDRLASAIRWPIKKPKQSSRHGAHGSHSQNRTVVPSKVAIATSVDNWQNRIELSRSHDDFVGILDLPEGRHMYKFLVDGEWKINPEDNTETDAETGEVFNVITIEKSDFDIFNALEDDDNAIKLLKDKKGELNFCLTKPKLKPKQSDSLADEEQYLEEFDDYSQEIPDKSVLKASGKDKKMATAILPPHLLQKILLNEQVHHSYEPSLLPEPQHVMLNHLYALAIRNGVMALSATGRYKKKFVTTLLYKPL